MRKLLLLSLAALAACGQPAAEGDFASTLAGANRLEGFFDLYHDTNRGRLYLEVAELDAPFLYQSSMARGVGSNDLGLDRGQLGDAYVVEFQRHGDKLLLVAQNLDYRAQSDSSDERDAVAASFAQSVLWGFPIAGRVNDALYVDATDFFLRDAHGLSRRLQNAGEGSYSVDASRSAIFAPRTKAFPDNSEIEAVITFKGEPTGKILRTVVPDPTSITVHLHHSLIRLPDDDYEPLPYDPRAGLIGLSYGTDGFTDYATAIGDELRVRFARRHRLEKKDPAAPRSEAVEPIVYYVDRGAPEPVRSALIEGGNWWNQAFEAAGYDNAFRVELLPEGADPMDVRYNVIQWVHRSTRGWSYGSSVLDPRTGEIMKGHVTLGSLRVRQDYLIAEGLLAPYGDRERPDAMLDMSLSRIRQLSAHEIGHTIGIEHNFAASTQGRTSVMDYPFPLIGFGADGELDLSDAYGVGVGAWDRRVILYGYQDFPDGVDANAERERILAETVASLKYVSDEDSRGVGTAHPDGNLWDNGADAIAELEHLLRVRAHALGRFSPENIRNGRPLATLEEALVPVYLLHRFQLHAVGKLLGGEYFNYALRGDGQETSRPVSSERQRAALHALLATINPAVLQLSPDLLASIPPRPPGYSLTRESFPRETGPTFDAFGPARSAVALTLEVLLEPQRAARLNANHALDARKPGFDEVLRTLLSTSWYANHASGQQAEIQRLTNTLVLDELMRLALNEQANAQVRALAGDSVATLDAWLQARIGSERDVPWRAHYRAAKARIEAAQTDPDRIRALPPVTVPPGSPIGAY
jgi:Met-zincin/Domain of unknown function (DUF5117)